MRISRLQFIGMFACGIQLGAQDMRPGVPLVNGLQSQNEAAADQAALKAIVYGYPIVGLLMNRIDDPAEFKGSFMVREYDDDFDSHYSVGYVARYLIYVICSKVDISGKARRMYRIGASRTQKNASAITQREAVSIYREWWSENEKQSGHGENIVEFLKQKGLEWK